MDHNNGVPPKRVVGRKRSPASLDIEALKVGGHHTYTPDHENYGSLAGISHYWGERLGRVFVTRSDESGAVSVWRVS